MPDMKTSRHVAALLVVLLACALAPSAARAQFVPAGYEFVVNTHTTNGQYRPSVAMDVSGSFVCGAS